MSRDDVTHDQLIAFLNGEGEINGRFFGDRDEKGHSFWWRKHLPALRGASGGGLEETDCETCQGNGEIVLDWDVYLHPPEDAPADAGVADCPDCDGTGKVDAPDHPAENAKPSGEVDGWQPIETAPKDGTRVLLWTSTDIELSDREYVRTICEGEHVILAQIGKWDHDWEIPLIGVPTHWRPLPAPPAALARSGKGEG